MMEELRAEAGSLPLWMLAEVLDAEDELGSFRSEFHFPKGKEVTYLCGNSLGLQPKRIRDAVNADLDRWAKFGVEGHFLEEEPGVPWWTIEDICKKDLASVVGARAEEVAVMNSLTVNLHLLLAAFYAPTEDSYEIVIEAHAFPSDEYAVQSVVEKHGLDASMAVVRLDATNTADLCAQIRERGSKVAVVLIAPLQYYTGTLYNIRDIVVAARSIGAVAGFDLAHAVGNVEVNLHDDDADFACWCSYKYLNAGPGAIGGAFVHAKYVEDETFPAKQALRGWWGNKRETRFDMKPTFDPLPGVAGLQLSNPPTLPVLALREALSLTAEAGLPRLRRKSIKLTAYLELLLREALGDTFSMLTPSNPDERGAQLSLLFVNHDVDAIFEGLRRRHVFVDVRRPDVIRVAPAPLYNSFKDVSRFVTHLKDAIAELE